MPVKFYSLLFAISVSSYVSANIPNQGLTSEELAWIKDKKLDIVTDAEIKKVIKSPKHVDSETYCARLTNGDTVECSYYFVGPLKGQTRCIRCVKEGRAWPHYIELPMSSDYFYRLKALEQKNSCWDRWFASL